jgi:hypothetical protein
VALLLKRVPPERGTPDAAVTSFEAGTLLALRWAGERHPVTGRRALRLAA